jgi:hypothetical protein
MSAPNPQQYLISKLKFRVFIHNTPWSLQHLPESALHVVPPLVFLHVRSPHIDVHHPVNTCIQFFVFLAHVRMLLGAVRTCAFLIMTREEGQAVHEISKDTRIAGNAIRETHLFHRNNLSSIHDPFPGVVQCKEWWLFLVSLVFWNYRCGKLGVRVLTYISSRSDSYLAREYLKHHCSRTWLALIHPCIRKCSTLLIARWKLSAASCKPK